MTEHNMDIKQSADGGIVMNRREQIASMAMQASAEPSPPQPYNLPADPPDRMKFAAQDESGNWWGYEAEPVAYKYSWGFMKPSKSGPLYYINDGEPHPDWTNSLHRWDRDKRLWVAVADDATTADPTMQRVPVQPVASVPIADVGPEHPFRDGRDVLVKIRGDLWVQAQWEGSGWLVASYDSDESGGFWWGDERYSDDRVIAVAPLPGDPMPPRKLEVTQALLRCAAKARLDARGSDYCHSEVDTVVQAVVDHLNEEDQ